MLDMLFYISCMCGFYKYSCASYPSWQSIEPLYSMFCLFFFRFTELKHNLLLATFTCIIPKLAGGVASSAAGRLIFLIAINRENPTINRRLIDD